MFEVFLCFPFFLVVLGCFLKLFPMFCLLLVSSSLIVVVLGCGMCFGWFYVVLGCFTILLVSCFNWCLVVSIF